VAWLVAGIVVLIGGVSTLATGNYLQGEAQKPKPVSQAVQSSPRTVSQATNGKLRRLSYTETLEA